MARRIRLAEIPPCSLARPDLIPNGCPIRSWQIVLRDVDGSLFPELDATHETFTAEGYQKAAEFSIIAQGLTLEEIDLVRKNAEAWDDVNFQGVRFGQLHLAEAIGRAHETMVAATEARRALEHMATHIQGRANLKTVMDMLVSPTCFQRKHGTAERWNICNCAECLAGKGVASCTAPLPSKFCECKEVL